MIKDHQDAPTDNVDNLDNLTLNKGEIINKDDQLNKSDNLTLSTINTTTYTHILPKDDQDYQSLTDVDNVDQLTDSRPSYGFETCPKCGWEKYITKACGYCEAVALDA
jgi:hypothetical protein